MKSALGAATGFAGVAATSHADRHASTIADGAKAEAVYSPSDSEGAVCWIPAGGPSDAQQALDGIVLDPALASQPRTMSLAKGIGVGLPFAGYAIAKDMALAREDYLSRIAMARDSWVRNGSVVSEAVAREVSDARFALRESIRRLYPVSGFFARTFDVARKIVGFDLTESKVASRMTEGLYDAVIDGAFKTNKLANEAASFARSSMPLSKALGIGGTVVMAAEVPYRAYQIYVAQDKEELQTAFVKFTEAAVGATVTAVCLAVGIGSGGVALLACGVAPVVAGIFAGQAAQVIVRQIR